MNKKISIFLFWFFVSVNTTFAETIMLAPPTLQETLEKNEEIARMQATSQKTEANATEKFMDFSYRKEFSGRAMDIYRANEAMLWMQEIRLWSGASVDSAIEVVSYNAETGEPQYQKKTITKTLSDLEKTPTSLINGQFFNPVMQPSELSFGLKQGEKIRSAGADNRNFDKNILRIDKNMAEIVPYSWENLRNSPDFAMVNLTMKNKSYSAEKIGRTYMCLKNPNAKNQSSTILTFVATDISEAEIEREILRQGCTEKSTSQLDSSGSTRLWFAGKYIFWANHKGEPDKRTIPHFIVFYDAP